MTTSVLQTQTKTASITEMVSLTLMKNLMRTTISSVAYLRGFFPDEVFNDRQLEGLKLKLMKRGVCEQADLLMDWLELGCFDAMEKKYLRVIVLAVFRDEELTKLVETYTYKFSYGENGETSGVLTRNGEIVSKTSSHDKAQLKKQTQDMLRNLVISAQSLCTLPSQMFVTVKLHYYDHTPEDYEPPYFKKTSEEDTFVFDHEYLQLRVGSIATPHHSMKLRIKSSTVPDTDKLLVSPGEGEKLNGSGHEEMTEGISKKRGSKDDLKKDRAPISDQTEDSSLSKELGSANSADRAIECIVRNQMITPNAPVPPAESVTEQASDKGQKFQKPKPKTKLHHKLIVRCPCESEKNAVGGLLCCTECKYYQHAVCFGWVNEEDTNTTRDHLCDECVNRGSSYPTYSIANMYNVERSLSMKRARAIRTMVMYMVTTTPGPKITAQSIISATGYSRESITAALLEMKADGFVKAGNRQSYPIVKHAIKQTSYTHYLQTRNDESGEDDEDMETVTENTKAMCVSNARSNTRTSSSVKKPILSNLKYKQKWTTRDDDFNEVVTQAQAHCWDNETSVNNAQKYRRSAKKPTQKNQKRERPVDDDDFASSQDTYSAKRPKTSVTSKHVVTGRQWKNVSRPVSKNTSLLAA
eukprot:CFRG7354T1